VIHPIRSGSFVRFEVVDKPCNFRAILRSVGRMTDDHSLFRIDIAFMATALQHFTSLTAAARK
jgi:hypothetical protein